MMQKVFFLLFYTSVIFQLSVCINTTYILPKMKSLDPIIYEQYKYGKVIKIRANQKYIIRFSNFSQINIWQAKTFSYYNSFNSSTALFNNAFSSGFNDFCLFSQESDLIGILTKRQIVTFNLTSLSIVHIFKNPNPGNHDYQRCIFTKKNMIILINDNLKNKKTFRRYNRIRQNFLTDLYLNWQNIYPVNVQICQPNTNTQIYVFIGRSYRLDYYQCINDTCKYGSILDPQIGYQFPQSRVKFSQDCNYLYAEKNNYVNSIIYKFPNFIQKQSLKFNEIQLFDEFDEMNIYSIFVLTNNSVLIYQNNLENTNSSKLIKIFQINSSITTHSNFQKYQNTFYLSIKSGIAILKFQCENGTYMIYNNLCIQCSNTCGQCNNVDGKCITCVDNTYHLFENGSCLISKDQIKFIYQFQNQIVLFTLPGITKIIEIVSFSLSFLNIPILSFFFLNFINFWTIISIYTFLDIQIAGYLKKLLDSIYNIVNLSLFQLLNNLFQVQTFKNVQIPLKQKMNNFYSTKYGLSSKFIESNFSQIIILFFSYFLILLLFFIRKYAISKNSYFYTKLDWNYILIGFQIISTSLMSFCVVFCLLFTEVNFNCFGQKINIFLIITSISLSLMIPFLQISSYKYQYLKQFQIKKKNIQKKRKVSFLTILNNNSSSKQNKKSLYNSKQNKINYKIHKRERISEKLKNIYMVICNIILPIFISTSLLYRQFELFFFIIVFIFYCFGIYIQSFNEEYKVHYILFNVYFLIFHSGLFVIWLFQQYINLDNEQLHKNILHISSFLCFIILILGVSHQILFFLYQILREIYLKIHQYIGKSKICQQMRKKEGKLVENKKYQFFKFNKSNVLIKNKVKSIKQQKALIQTQKQLKKIKQTLLVTIQKKVKIKKEKIMMSIVKLNKDKK